MKSKVIEKYGRNLIVYENGDIFREAFTDKNGKRWPLKKLKQNGERPLVGLSIDNKFRPLRVDRLVAEAFLQDYSDDLDVYPKNGDRKICAASNLRIVPKSASRKLRTKKGGSCYSNFKGVTWCNRQKHWIAQCWLNGSNNYLGQYKDEKDAAKAYNKFAKKNGFLEGALNNL